MEIKPVKQTEKPKYPLKTELKDEELKKQIPRRWASSPAAKIALGTLAVVTLTGCAPERIPGLIDTVIPPTEASVSTTPNYVPEGTTVPAMINVAPLFQHGDGRGAFGCVMVAPPVFLSEEDALSVVNEVAKEYGLEFTVTDGPELSNVLQPNIDLTPDMGEDSAGKTKGLDKVINLKADFAEASHDIAIEYVSVDDIKEWAGPSGATVDEYDTKEAADQLCDALEQAVPADYGFYTMGVLYDPCEYSDNSKPGSVEQLKAQAKDFFEWLKTQGVI